jgi:hypothetical protein
VNCATPRKATLSQRMAEGWGDRLLNMSPAPESKPNHGDGAAPGVPPPTLWPAALALAVTLMLWGLASSLIVTAVGLGLFAASIAGWIAEIRHERRPQ